MNGRLASERGTTLVELMVGLAAGMVVLAALSMVIITTMRGSARVSTRVEATQRARLTLTQVTEQLHSACILPQIVPIFGESSGDRLAFIHASGPESFAVSPAATKSVIALDGGTLRQRDYDWTGGPYPKGEAAAPPTERVLLTDVAPLSPGAPIFNYFEYANGALARIPLEGEQTLGDDAGVAVQVQVALNADPLDTPVADPGADISIQDSAVLRLTPPSFNETTAALPCR